MDWKIFGDVTVSVLAGLTMLIGWLSLLFVIVPGLVIMWVGALVYGIATGFNTSGWIIFGIMTILMIVGSIIDNFIMGASARQKGASWWGLAVAWLAAIAGTILLPPVGGLDDEGLAQGSERLPHRRLGLGQLRDGLGDAVRVGLAEGDDAK